MNKIKIILIIFFVLFISASQEINAASMDEDTTKEVIQETNAAKKINETIPKQDITKDITPETFDALNPLKIAGSPVAEQLSTPGGIISRVLGFLFPFAGLILFFLIVWGGFEILIGASDQKGMEAGKNRITAAIIGFILLFSSYWMTQIIEVVFGIRIL